MKQYYVLSALLALLSFLPARAQIVFSDSLQISLLTCSAGPDAYERFGHTGIRIQDLKETRLDLTFHYGVFSFNEPHFIYRFVKGETYYKLGALYTRDFIAEYRERGLGMTEQWLRFDSAQCQEIANLLLENYRPENRTYRYSYFFDNCSTRPFNLFNRGTDHSIRYDTTWVKEITLRDQVQEKTHINNWLDFGIALAVSGRADRTACFTEQLFLPEYLSRALDHAEIPVRIGEGLWYEPLVTGSDTLLEMRPAVAAQIDAPDPIRPATVCAVLLLLGIALSGWEYKVKRRHWTVNLFDCLFFFVMGLTGFIVWFLNFFSLHPAVDHNLNILWLLPTHLIAAVWIWFQGIGNDGKLTIWQRIPRIYFGITFALVIVYVVLDWIYGQYCPPPFLLLLALILLRSFMRARA